jgi:hypothetical protein
MSKTIKPVFSQFEIEVNIAGTSPAWDPRAEMISGDPLCGLRLLSREVQSIEAVGATTTTRVNQETIDDD